MLYIFRMHINLKSWSEFNNKSSKKNFVWNILIWRSFETLHFYLSNPRPNIVFSFLELSHYRVAILGIESESMYWIMEMIEIMN